jgi:two-component system sensor histidine kinase PilS (NtrC family)
MVAGVVVGWLGLPSYLFVPFLSYCFITLATLLVILFQKKIRFHTLLKFLIALQFACEIINELGIVYSTGNLYSRFSILFLLTIVSAAMVYRLVGTLLVASIVSIAYAGITWFNASALIPGTQIIESFKFGFIRGDDAIFYSTFLHILVFYLVAFIAGYMAEKLQSKDLELYSASVELKKARLETGDILRHLNCGLITLDKFGNIVYFNRMAETILGLSEDGVSGANCRYLFSGRLAPLARNIINVLESEKRLSRSEFEIMNKDGNLVPLGLSTSILYDEEFNVRGVIAIFQDLTEAKRLEEKVRQADRLAAVGELSACIAHEIRNPLASISGSVQVLKEDLALDGDNEKLMSLILKESSRLNKILSDFLLYARVDRPQFRKVEIHRVISDVIELIRRHPSYSNEVQIELLSKNHITYISGDEDLLKQLLLNLAVNSCQAFDGKGGLIQFEVKTLEETKGETVRLIVRDNGPGIPKELMDRIFLPFYSTKKNGTGLGLSIVSRLIEALGGTMEVVSNPGQATEFHIFFLGIGQDAINVRPASAETVSFPR